MSVIVKAVTRTEDMPTSGVVCQFVPERLVEHAIYDGVNGGFQVPCHVEHRVYHVGYFKLNPGPATQTNDNSWEVETNQ